MRWSHGAALAALLGWGSFGGASGPASPGAWEGPPPARTVAERLPVVFEENLGQAPERFAFVSRPAGYQALIATDEALLLLPEGSRGRALRMRFFGATQRRAEAVGAEPLGGSSNYLRGQDPSKWVTGARHFGGILCRGVAPGVDVRWRTVGGSLRYDVELAAGASAASVSLGFEGAAGIHVDPDGSLVVRTEAGTLRHSRPVAYQPRAAGRDPVDARFVVRDGIAGFALGAHDSARPVVIDPTIEYATFVGGSGFEILDDIAVDGSGNAYVCGQTRSTDFPLVGAVDATFEGFQEAFVSKLDPTGSTLVYSTYIGGDGTSDRARGIALDASGGVVVAGSTNSTDFPVVNAIQATRVGTSVGFVLELAPSGASFDFSTYLGGGLTTLYDVAVGPQGGVYVAGSNSFGGYPLQSPLQAQAGSNTDAVVSKLAADGSALVYSTYLGGSATDNAFALAVDPAGSAYLAGSTASADFPTTVSAFQPTAASGAWVAKLDAAGSALLYSTYLAGSGSESAAGIAVDASGAACVVGVTGSADFPTLNAVHPALVGTDDGFLTRLAPSGQTLEFSSYLGRPNSSSDASAVAVDPSGTCHVAWTTAPPPPPMQEVSPSTVVVEAFDVAGARVESVELDGSDSEFAFGLDVLPDGTRFVGMDSLSSDFPTTASALQPTNPGSRTGAVVRLAPVSAGLGDGLLYASRCIATVNWAKHGRGKTADAFVLRGCMNPRGALEDLSGATATVTLNGTPLVTGLPLDRKGAGKTPRGESPSVRLRFVRKNGKLAVSLRKGDLQTALGLADATASGESDLEVGVTIEGAGLATESVVGRLRAGYVSRAGKTTKARFKFAANASLDGAFKATRTRVSERADGQSASVRAVIEAPAAVALEPVGGVTLSIGGATLVIPQASLHVTGSGAAARFAYRRSLGAVAGLRSLKWDNRRGTFSCATDALALGLPAAGTGASTAAELTLSVEMDLAVGRVRFATTVELLRPKDSAKNWSR